MLQTLQLDLHFLAELVVKGREGFIKQQNLRLWGQGPGQRVEHVHERPALLVANALAREDLFELVDEKQQPRLWRFLDACALRFRLESQLSR